MIKKNNNNDNVREAIQGKDTVTIYISGTLERFNRILKQCDSKLTSKPSNTLLKGCIISRTIKT